MDAERPTPVTTDEDVPSTVDQLDAEECWRLLRQADVARLAVAAAGDVDIYPVNIVVDGDTLVFRTAEGTKLVEVVLSGRVALEVDGWDVARGEAWSVVAKGAATLLERFDDIYRAEGLPLFPWNTGPKERFVRITPTTVTGRRFRVASSHLHPAP